MIHLVFVHGVNTRKDADDEAGKVGKYTKGVADRHEFIKKYCFPNDQVQFYDPYWGGAGSNPRFGLACIPTKGGTTLDITASALGIGDPSPAPVAPLRADTHVLLDEAKVNFAGVTNTLSIELARPGATPERLQLAKALAIYTMDLETDDDGSVVAPDWLTDPGMKTDQQFLDQLEAEAKATALAKGEAHLAIGGILKGIGSAIVGAGIDLISGIAEPFVRNFTPKLVQFLGDAFVYLHEGSARAEIRKIVLDSLTTARQACQAGDHLVVICHSMGANIVYDMYTDPKLASPPAAAALPKIDLFVSVGTQLGLLEELSLFPTSPASGTAIANYPAPCGPWWHVYNLMDVLSFRAENIFKNVQEFRIDTSANIVDAHTAYFTSILFWMRLNKRLQTAGIAT